jgi:hypothetical protein
MKNLPEFDELPQECPTCGAAPFDVFLRGVVVRSSFRWPPWKRRANWAVICRVCKDIVGYEHERRLV